MKVHAVTLLIVDHDDLGAEEIKTVLENQNYPNDCIHAHVMHTETRIVEWTDQHPLNSSNLRTCREAFVELFADRNVP